MGIKRQKSEAILLLGGNIGNVKKAFREVCDQLMSFGELVQKSSLYETEAWGMKNAPAFLNQVLILKTQLTPNDLLTEVLKIETGLGRLRNEKATYSSREIDIDILFYDDVILNYEDLIIPHPKLHQRKFTLMPLNEIVPEFIHPGFNASISELLEKLDDKLEVKKVNE